MPIAYILIFYLTMEITNKSLLLL